MRYDLKACCYSADRRHNIVYMSLFKIIRTSTFVHSGTFMRLSWTTPANFLFNSFGHLFQMDTHFLIFCREPYLVNSGPGSSSKITMETDRKQAGEGLKKSVNTINYPFLIPCIICSLFFKR